MSKIIKTKFYCKGTSKSAPRVYSLSDIGKVHWTSNYIEGKWYDGEYELWYDEDEYSERNQKMFKINGRWRRYQVVNEQSELKEITISYMNIIFEMNLIENRNNKIEEILKNKK